MLEFIVMTPVPLSVNDRSVLLKIKELKVTFESTETATDPVPPEGPAAKIARLSVPLGTAPAVRPLAPVT
jgi:hypothetical protein